MNVAARKPIAIVHASVHGQTEKIAERIANRLDAAGWSTRVMDFGAAGKLEPADHAAVILGAPVRYGRHDRRLIRLVARHASALETGVFGLFSVDLISRNPDKTRPGNNVYLRKLLKRLAVSPDALAIFAGRLDYPRYGWLDRRLIRLIMKIMDGPTDPSTVVEYTDWNRVERFADEISKLSLRECAAGRART